MKKKKSRTRYRLFILSLCCLLFILSVVSVFILYQHRLTKNFQTVLTNGLEENTKGHRHRAELVLANLRELLDTMHQTLDPSESDPHSAAWELTLENNCIRIDYLEFRQLPDLSSPELPDMEKKIFQKLMNGEEAVTDLGTSPFTESSSSFTLLHPVFQEERLSGALRAQVDVSLLTEEKGDSVSFFQKDYVILTKSDGSMVYADTPYPNSQNFFSSALENGIDSDEIQEVQKGFEETDSGTVSFHGKGNQYYMSWASLSFNDWRIVRFARSPDVILQTTTFVRGTILTGICLIALTAVFCIVLIQFLLRQKRQLMTQQRRYDALAQFNDTLLFEFDVPSDRMTFTPNALARLDLDPSCLEGVPMEYYIKQLLHPDDRESIHQTIPPSGILLGKTYYLELRLRCRSGEFRWFGCQFKSIENRGERASRVVGKLADISDQRGREQVLKQAALTDTLTGIYNRAAETVINNLLQKEPKGLFFMIDLDDFKTVNDTYGHAAGDALLISIAQTLKEVFRPEDIIARIGGDEFVVFISGIHDRQTAESKAAVIQNRMEQLCIPGSTHSVSASIGVAGAPQGGSTFDELTRAADQAMYAIKQDGKKGVAFHTHRKE